MVDILDTRREEQNTIDSMRLEFGTAKAGDIIKIKRGEDDYNYLLLSKANTLDSNSRKSFAVTNLNSSFTWRYGGVTLDKSFDIWFMKNDRCSILDLEVIKDSRISVTSRN